MMAAMEHAIQADAKVNGSYGACNSSDAKDAHGLRLRKAQ